MYESSWGRENGNGNDLRYYANEFLGVLNLLQRKYGCVTCAYVVSL